ncbi:hypothetical protein AAC387_Pa03g3857 [Persea americana]
MLYFFRANLLKACLKPFPLLPSLPNRHTSFPPDESDVLFEEQRRRGSRGFRTALKFEKTERIWAWLSGSAYQRRSSRERGASVGAQQRSKKKDLGCSLACFLISRPPMKHSKWLLLAVAGNGRL